MWARLLLIAGLSFAQECSSFDNCSTCVEEHDCGWCGDGSCQTYNTSLLNCTWHSHDHSGEELCHGDIDHNLTSCNASNCTDCTAAHGCGWCGAAGCRSEHDNTTGLNCSWHHDHDTDHDHDVCEDDHAHGECSATSCHACVDTHGCGWCGEFGCLEISNATVNLSCVSNDHDDHDHGSEEDHDHEEPDVCEVSACIYSSCTACVAAHGCGWCGSQGCFAEGKAPAGAVCEWHNHETMHNHAGHDHGHEDEPKSCVAEEAQAGCGGGCVLAAVFLPLTAVIGLSILAGWWCTTHGMCKSMTPPKDVEMQKRKDGHVPVEGA